MNKTQFVKTLQDQELVESVFLIKFSAVATGKTGKPYMTLVMMDKTGDIEARIWDDIPRYAGQAVKDAFVAVEGKCQLFNGKKQIVIKQLHVVREDEVNSKDFISESSLDPEDLYRRMLGYIASMEDPHYRALVESVFRDDADAVQRLKRAPAAKTIHHAYRGGLLEHVVSIIGILDALSKHYGPIMQRDLLFVGGFFHDIGKLWELSYERVTDYTDEGRLIGHLVMGVELIDRKIRELVASGKLSEFPENKKLLAKHMVLAHHGKYEFGSPKRPKCIEALVVHYIDDLDSRINAISTFIAQDQTPGLWTGLHRNMERYFWKHPENAEANQESNSR